MIIGNLYEFEKYNNSHIIFGERSSKISLNNLYRRTHSILCHVF